jgi:hypothetical protein
MNNRARDEEKRIQDEYIAGWVAVAEARIAETEAEQLAIVRIQDERTAAIDREGREWGHLFSSVRHGVADLVTTTEGAGEALLRLGDRIASTLLDTVLAKALKPAEDALASFLAQLTKAGISSISGYFGGGAAGVGAGGAVAGDFGAGLGTVGLPAYAAGGIVTRPTLGIVGEAGPEAIVPLDQYRGGGDTYATIVDQRGGGAPEPRVRESMANGRREIEVLITDVVRGGLASGAYDRALQSSYGVSRRGVR